MPSTLIENAYPDPSPAPWEATASLQPGQAKAVPARSSSSAAARGTDRRSGRGTMEPA